MYAVRVDRRERKLKVVAAPPPAGDPPGHPAAIRLRARGHRDARGDAERGPRAARADAAVLDPQHERRLRHDGRWLPARTTRRATPSGTPVPWPLIFPMIAVILQKGGVYPNSVHIPADAPLGLYRLVGFTGFTGPTFEVIA